MTSRRKVFAYLLALLAAVAPAHAPAATTAPAEPAVPPLRMPAPVTRTLANGLRVVVFPTARAPIVQVQLLVPAGSAAANDTTPGVATLTAGLLGHGTTSRSAQQFHEELGRLGATFAAGTDRDYTLVSCGAQTSSFEGLLELMSDAVLNPLFGADDFDAAVQDLARKIGSQSLNLADLADARLGEVAFGAHPYARPVHGGMQALMETTRDRVRAFHRDRWRPDRAVLAIAGDVDPARAFAAAEDWFGRWAGRTSPDRPQPEPRSRSGVGLVDVAEARRAEVRVGVVGAGAADPAYPSWALAAAALENGRVPEGVRVSLVTARDASLLVLAGAAAPADAAALARRMIDALHAFAAAPPAGADLDAIRRRAARRYPLRLETLGAQLTQWQADDFAGRPADGLARGGERVAAANLAPVTHALAGTPAVLVAGPAAAQRAPLAALGRVEDLAIEATRAAAPDTLATPTPEQLRRGRAAVAAAVAAHGGALRLAAVKSLVFEGDITLNVEGQDLTGMFSLVRVNPDRMSFATRVLKFESRAVLDGDAAWSVTKSDSVATVESDSTGADALHITFFADVVHQLLFASAPDAAPAWRGTELVTGLTCDLVDYVAPYGGRHRMAIDTRSHRVIALDAGLVPGPAWMDRRVLSDFHPVNGVVIPLTEERLESGQRTARLVASKAAVDREIDAALFRRPEGPSGH